MHFSGLSSIFFYGVSGRRQSLSRAFLCFFQEMVLGPVSFGHDGLAQLKVVQTVKLFQLIVGPQRALVIGASAAAVKHHLI